MHFSDAEFVEAMRSFWTRQGLPFIDGMVIVLVPTTILAPFWVSLFR